MCRRHRPQDAWEQYPHTEGDGPRGKQRRAELHRVADRLRYVGVEMPSTLGWGAFLVIPIRTHVGSRRAMSRRTIGIRM